MDDILKYPYHRVIETFPKHIEEVTYDDLYILLFELRGERDFLLNRDIKNPLKGDLKTKAFYYDADTYDGAIMLVEAEMEIRDLDARKIDINVSQVGICG